jgi:predicted DNA-binding transcriptional regulator YafY
MSQTERLQVIQKLLTTHRSVSLQTIMERLSISRATAKREIAYMRDRLQAPIVWDRELRGYRLEGSFSLPAVYLNSSEINALLVLHQLVVRIQPSFLDEHLEPLRTLLHRLLGKEGGDDKEALARRIRILQLASRPVASEHFQAVCRALLGRQRLHLKYYSRSRDRESERDVSPQRLVHYRDNWYLDAWCHEKGALRSFSLDAVKAAEHVDEPAIDIADSDLDRELGGGYGIFSGPATRHAVLRFSPEMARWVSREKWHSQQESRFEADGSYVLTMPYSAERELLMDIMRFGPDVEVLAPPELRSSVVEALRKAAARYG